MDIQHMTYFLALADTLNYTAAAKQCFISRQGMRQAIQSIEQEYDLALVINEHNHLSLTPAGKLLQAHAKSILDAFSRMEQAMQQYTAQTETIHFGISRSLLPFYAPALIQKIEHFAKHLPPEAMDIQILNTDEIIQGLHAHTLDGGLIVELEDPDHARDLPWSYTVLQKNVMTILMSSTHPLADKGALTLQDLSGQTVLLMSDPEICFAPLYTALKEQHIPVHFQVVPDYFEVGYRLMNSDAVAIDREEATPPSPSHLDRNLSLDNGRFTLNCCLLTAHHATDKMSALREYIMH